MKFKQYVVAGIIFLSAMLIFGNSAQAESYWGAETLNVVIYAPSYWGGSNSNPVYDYDGGQGYVSAASSISDYRGHTASSAILRFNGGLTPRLSSDAFVTADDRLWGASGTVWAIEQYTYTGTAPTDLTLNVHISGSLFVNPAEYSTSYGTVTSGTRIEADVYIFNQNNFGYYHDIGTLIGEAGATSKGSVSFWYDEDGDYDDNGQIVFSVNPGETFYLWSMLETPAQWVGSFADAGSTMTMSFVDGSNLQTGTVPIPGSLFLFVPGLVCLMAFRKK